MPPSDTVNHDGVVAMAYEIQPWKKVNCSLTLPTKGPSEREPHSREINEAFGEGGGLNADYRTVEAVAIAAATLGRIGLVYGIDFVFKTGGAQEISFDFRDEATKIQAIPALNTLMKRNPPGTH